MKRPCFWWALSGIVPAVAMLVVMAIGPEWAEQVSARRVAERFSVAFLQDGHETAVMPDQLRSSIADLLSKYGKLQEWPSGTGGKRQQGNPLIRTVSLKLKMEKGSVDVIAEVRQLSTGHRVDKFGER